MTPICFFLFFCFFFFFLKIEVLVANKNDGQTFSFIEMQERILARIEWYHMSSVETS